MHKATKFTLCLAVFLILLFSAAILMTFVNDWLQQTGFFGDTKASEPIGAVDTGYEWGARHYYYNILCMLLFALSVARIIIWANWYWKDSKSK